MEASTAWRAQLVKASSSEHEVSSRLSSCLSGNSAWQTWFGLIRFMRKNPAFSPAPMPVLMWYHLSDNSWESLKIRQRALLLLRTEHDSCRIADKRTLGDSWSSIPNVANAFAATLLEAQKMFFDVAIPRGSKRATLAAWDAEAPEIRKANSRPSSTTLVDWPGTWLCTFSSFHVLSDFKRGQPVKHSGPYR